MIRILFVRAQVREQLASKKKFELEAVAAAVEAAGASDQQTSRSASVTVLAASDLDHRDMQVRIQNGQALDFDDMASQDEEVRRGSQGPGPDPGRGSLAQGSQRSGGGPGLGLRGGFLGEWLMAHIEKGRYL